MRKMKVLFSLISVATLAIGVGVATLNIAPTEIANADATHTETIFMVDGAAIRYSEPAGIRFTGYVKDDGDLSDNVVGFKISVGGVEKDFSTASLEGSAWKWSESEVDGYKKFQVAITGIPESQYTTEMTAQAYVDNVESEQIVTRSIATVANAALAADTLEGKLDAEQNSDLEKYVNDGAATLPFDGKNTAISGELLSWEAVDNAKGYLVQLGNEVKNVPCNGAETYSVNLADFKAEAGTVTLLPYGDGKAYTYAETPYTAVYAGTPVLASFNETSDVSRISNVAGVGYSVGQYPYNGKPSFETQTAGTVYFRVYNDDYRTDGSDWTNLAAFTVTLNKPLDLNGGYDGVKIRLQMKVSKAGSATLEMLANGKNTEWNQNPSGVSTTVEDGYTAPVWVELKVTNEQLVQLGYASGDAVLTFGIRGSGKQSSEQGNNAEASIDFVEYYEAEDAPSAVAKELVGFNEASDAGRISNVAGYAYAVGQYPYNGAPSFDGVDVGTVSFRIYNEDYRGSGTDWTKLAAFTVTLSQELDLESGYAGIKIRLNMKVSETGSATLEMLANGQNTQWNDMPSDVNIAVENANTAAWVELYITNEQLAQLGYKTGDTVLTFGIRSSKSRSTENGSCADVSIDCIEYYEEDDT